MGAELFAGIEAGGTKILCALADSGGRLLAEQRIPTTDPDTSFAAIAHFFAEALPANARIVAAGIASFGPLDLDPTSAHFGELTTTPKVGWPGTSMRGRIRAMLDVPTVIDTDVNCAGLAEGLLGAAQGLERFCYLTVGTGIGVGLIDRGEPECGQSHSEVGHMRVPRAAGDDFAGICPYHGDCVEGLACGPAMKARWSASAEDLGEDHVGWTYEAHYIAAICANLTYVVRPHRIIAGGGVLERSSLYAQVRAAYREMVASYALDRWSADPETYIVAPALVTPSPGLTGAIELARRAHGAAVHGH